MLEATWFYWVLKCSADAWFTSLVYEPASKYIPLQLCDSRRCISSVKLETKCRNTEENAQKKINPSVFYTGFLLRSGFAGQKKNRKFKFIYIFNDAVSPKTI